MTNFILIWFGQLVSLTGSGLTRFALGVWVYQSTQSVTLFTLITLCNTLPLILITPLAGSLVDRWPRRWVMILSDSGNCLCTLGIAILLANHSLNIYSIYVLTAINCILNTFQWPAYAAAITLLVPKNQLTRASGLTQVAEAVGQLFSPVLAAVLLVSIGLQGIIVIDLVTFSFAFLTLILSRFPEPDNVNFKFDFSINFLLKEFVDGWNYVVIRPGLLSLLVFFATCNFLIGFITVLFAPLVLSLFSSITLGWLESIGGIGMVLGSLTLIARSEPKRYIDTIFILFWAIALSVIIAGWHSSIIVLAIANFVIYFCAPIIFSCSQVIWQRKIPLEVQGRVFALRRMVARSCIPLAALIAGPLDELVFEPLMAVNGLFANSLGQFIGTGTGRGIDLIFIVAGISILIISIVAYQYPRLRFIEDELPDAIPTLESSLSR